MKKLFLIAVFLFIVSGAFAQTYTYNVLLDTDGYILDITSWPTTLPGYQAVQLNVNSFPWWVQAGFVKIVDGDLWEDLEKRAELFPIWPPPEPEEEIIP